MVSYIYFNPEPIFKIGAWIVGVPLLLVALSLLFGDASRGNGLFTPLTLYFIGLVILFASIAGVLAGVHKSAAASTLSFACFALARNRKNKF